LLLANYVLNEYNSIELFIKALNKTDIIEIKYMHPEKIEGLDLSIESHIYRIALELINNTLKHAQATKISIEIKVKNQQFVLDYSDNGLGCELELSEENTSKGNGLKNILSRAKFLKAKAKFSSMPMKGFHFKMEMPLV